MLASTSDLLHTKDRVKVQPGPTPLPATSMSALLLTHVTSMLLAPTKMMAPRAANVMMASTVTDTSASLTLVPPTHARLTLPAPTTVTTSLALATLDSTTEQTPSRVQPATSETKMPATLMSVLLLALATQTLPAPITMMVPRAALATMASTAMDMSASLTHVLSLHARLTRPAPTKETPILALATKDSTSVTTQSKAPPVTSAMRLLATLMSAPLLALAMPTLLALTTLMAPNLALATLTSRATA